MTATAALSFIKGACNSSSCWFYKRHVSHVAEQHRVHKRYRSHVSQERVHHISLNTITHELRHASGSTRDCIRFRPNSARNPFGALEIAFSPALLVSRVPQPPPRLFPARARSGRAPPPSASTSNCAGLAEMARHRGRSGKYLWCCC